MKRKKNTNTLVIILLLSFISLSSCNNDSWTTKEDGNILTNTWKDNPYKLNVIYFVPNDIDTVQNYRKRLSNILLQLQKFYGDNIQKAGYGYKSFGLDLLSDTKVNIITIKGEKGKIAYPYDDNDDNDNPVELEIKKYFQLHPNEKKSEHTLVIIPSYNSDPTDPGGPPFYGDGRSCYALDYPGMDIDKLGTSGIAGNLATKWIGGLAHELGHGLNFPHDKEHKTDQPTLGTALMGTGNHTYGKEPTFLTKAESAVFSTSQPFATVKKSNWYTPVQNNLTKLKGEFINNKIIISGKYTSSLPVSVIIVYHDTNADDEDNDYQALAWDTSPLQDHTFSVECSLNDFYNLSGKYELRLEFYHENGELETHNFKYQFDNGIPNISVIDF